MKERLYNRSDGLLPNRLCANGPPQKRGARVKSETGTHIILRHTATQTEFGIKSGGFASVTAAEHRQ